MKIVAIMFMISHRFGMYIVTVFRDSVLLEDSLKSPDDFTKELTQFMTNLNQKGEN